LTATRVELEKPGLGAASGTKAEVEGLVTDLSGSTFKVNGQLIDASSATFEPSGSTLALGIRVEVEGTIQSSGILVATKVEVKQETSVRIEAHVTELNGPPAKTLKVLGKTISLRGSTQFEDKVNNTRPFNLGNFDSVISVGDHLEVRAVKNKAGDLIATRVERNSDTEISLQGPLESESPLTIVGLPILTDGGTEFRDVDDSTIGSLAAFLNKVKVTPTPSIVKARGADAGADFNATGAVNGELEIEEP